MGRWEKLVVSLLVLGSCLWAAELRFEPEPRLLGTFQIVVVGVSDDVGEVVLFNLVTKEHLLLKLQKDGDVLKSPALQVLRHCDKLTVGDAIPVRISSVGEHLVAATDLACGLSAMAKVGPRAGAGEIRLEVWDGGEWKPAESLGAGEHRLHVVFPPADLSCERDRLPGGLIIRAGREERQLELKEDAETSGSFTWHFSGAFEVDKRTQQLLFVLRWAENLLKVPAVCMSVLFLAADQEFLAQIRPLHVEIKPDVALFVPAGCRITLALAWPKDPEEVLWWAAGQWFAGQILELAVDDGVGKLVPQYPEALVMKVFARKGETWGTTQVVVSFIPRPRLAFVDPGPAKEIVDPWPKDKEFKLRLSGAPGLPPQISVRMGKLGPHPRERVIALALVGEGVYESALLDPRDWQAEAGEVLWAQLCYPEPMQCVISVILRLR